MKKALKIFLYSLLSIVGFIVVVLLATYLTMSISANRKLNKALALVGSEVKMLTVDGFSFRDLNKNGKLDVYEDKRRPTEDRVNDLLAQMNLEEKAGAMFIPPISMNKDGSISEKPSLSDLFSLLCGGSSDMIFTRKMNHFNIFTGISTREMASWYNNLQKLAEKTRLAIPVTIASDPRNTYSNNPLASAFLGDFSAWPEPTGLAAIDDTLLTARFADIARHEYTAVGVRVALHPMADLATEPRWGRINGTFGEDAKLASRMVTAYLRGFQGDTLGPESVSCMLKHFSGGGPQKEGIDPHFAVAKGQIYPGKNFNYHLIPFEAAFKAGTSQIMPYYGIPVDQTSENVGFSFNREMITDLLRNKYHYDGIVCTDWGIITDMKFLGMTILPARARGMEKATEEERMLKVINAGVDQFGGEMIPEMLVRLVKENKVTEDRLDSSVKRLLRMKFTLGLFDNPFVDVEKAVKTVGKKEFMEAGLDAQRRSLVLLKNDSSSAGKFLPLKKGLKFYIRNIKPEKVAAYGTVVEKPEDADLAIIRINSPKQHIDGTGLLGNLFSAGDLDFKGKEKEDILNLLKTIPTVVDIYLDRPAVIPEIASAAKGLTGNFGVSDDALLDVLFGNYKPEGHLPFELPSSMEAVRNQKEDVPYDSKDPLFKFGFGLKY
jgi:beta-glucosidase